MATDELAREASITLTAEKDPSGRSRKHLRNSPTSLRYSCRLMDGWIGCGCALKDAGMSGCTTVRTMTSG
jgi:hypothetical protein